MIAQITYLVLLSVDDTVTFSITLDSEQVYCLYSSFLIGGCKYIKTKMVKKEVLYRVAVFTA